MDPAVFLDRDGTIIYDRSYMSRPSEVELIPGSARALRLLAALGYRLILVSNQSGLGRGLITAEQHAQVHRTFLDLLQREGCRLDGVYYCPHAPEVGCTCRKPEAGLLLTAAEELALDLNRSFMAGDRQSDVAAGAIAGCRTVLIRAAEPGRSSPGLGEIKSHERPLEELPASNGPTPLGPDAICRDLMEAAQWISTTTREKKIATG